MSRSLSKATFAALLLSTLAGCLLLSGRDAWPCATDADCDADERCRPWGDDGRLICTEAADCVADRDCDSASICQAGRCTKARCSAEDSSACAPYGCDASRRCRTWCDVQRDCQAGLACENHACVPGD